MSTEALGGYPHTIEEESAEIWMAPYLIAASAHLGKEGRLHALDAVAEIVDRTISNHKSPLYAEALQVIEYPLVNLYELVEALGVDGLEEVLKYAEEAIYDPSVAMPEEVIAYADLLGWNSDPAELDPRVVGAAILLSFLGSLNKTINETLEIED